MKPIELPNYHKREATKLPLNTLRHGRYFIANLHQPPPTNHQLPTSKL